MLFVLALLACPAFGYFEGLDLGTTPKAMNGISLEQYRDFWQSWHLVTVRYRSDVGEQRFVYANDLAYEGLKSRSRPDLGGKLLRGSSSMVFVFYPHAA